MARRHARLLALTAVIVAVVAFGFWRYSHRSLAPRYMTAPVTTGAVAHAVTASGTVNPMVTVQVGSYVSGVIETVS